MVTGRSAVGNFVVTGCYNDLVPFLIGRYPVTRGGLVYITMVDKWIIMTFCTIRWTFNSFNFVSADHSEFNL